MVGMVPDEENFFDIVEHESQEETAFLTQPNNAFTFLQTVKNMIDECLDFEDRLPGLVQIIEVRKATGEFRPHGHHKEVVAKVLCEDGVTRVLRGVEDYYPGTRDNPPDGELIFEEVK